MQARHLTIAIIVAGALFMQNLDSTVLGTALPTIAHSFGLSPVRLQTGFSYSALTSGLVTLASGAGALLMKFAVQRILVRFGFRPVLIWKTLLSAVSIAACALFTPATLPGIIFAVLFVGGCFRSLQFTAVNIIGYADLDRRQMSRATGFSSMVQQLSLSLGVGLGALMLDLSSTLRGSDQPAQGDFALALITVAVVVCAIGATVLPPVRRRRQRDRPARTGAAPMTSTEGWIGAKGPALVYLHQPAGLGLPAVRSGIPMRSAPTGGLTRSATATAKQQSAAQRTWLVILMDKANQLIQQEPDNEEVFN